MKVYIAYNITNNPHGGGNQFLRSLKAELTKQNLYTQKPEQADIILFNSHQNHGAILQLKKKFPDVKFVHRVDGPIRLYNKMSDSRDDTVYKLNNTVANATVFQSNWSKEKNIEMGMPNKHPHAVICNAVDENIFFSAGELQKDKIRLISASFSPNYRKGHKYYQFLDKALDFDKYEYVFAGQSPVGYNNISLLGCLSSRELANELRASHIYITASENDPCSNSLLEAISSGIQVLALRSGGHPELVHKEEHLFDNEEELLEKIINQTRYKNNIKFDTIEHITQKYVIFFKKLLENV